MQGPLRTAAAGRRRGNGALRQAGQRRRRREGRAEGDGGLSVQFCGEKNDFGNRERHNKRGGGRRGLREEHTYPANHPFAPTALAHHVPRAWDVSPYSANVFSQVATGDSAVTSANNNTIIFTIGDGVAIR